MSNAILVYNPHNQRYYKPDSYRLDPYGLPSSVYPMIVYNGGIFVSLHWDDAAPISKPYPPGTCAKDVNTSTNVLRSGTVMDIPMILLPLHTIWSNLMMIPPNQSQKLTCHLLYLNHLLMPLIPPTFCHVFSNWTTKLLLNMMEGLPYAITQRHLLIQGKR